MTICTRTSTLEYSYVGSASTSWDTRYIVSGNDRRIDGILYAEDASSTKSALEFKPLEPDVVPYECSRAGGVLSFWDDPLEDIYDFEDGHAV
jgi:hypothetical protein